MEIYQAFNLCGHAVGEHFVKVSTIISESVNQSSILYHWGGTYQTTCDVSEWVRHMPVDHRCQGHANKILFHAWPGDNWGLFDVKKTIIWKKSAVSQVNGARASIQVPALLTQSHAFSCLSLPRNFLRKNSSDLQHTGIKYLSIVNYHLQDVENLLSLLNFSGVKHHVRASFHSMQCTSLNVYWSALFMWSKFSYIIHEIDSCNLSIWILMFLKFWMS